MVCRPPWTHLSWDEKASVYREFESEMADVKHKFCSVCRRVSLQMKMKPVWANTSSPPICSQCSAAHETEQSMLDQKRLPVWYDDQGGVRYDVPRELSDLREGEKLLIQMVPPYVPLVHIKNGTLGVRVHVCSFPQRVTEVMSVLPRLPENVNLVKMVRNFRAQDGSTGTKAFVIRRHVVLAALHWLVKYNPLYREITIQESNLD